MEIIKTENLTFTYKSGEKKILDNINFSVNEGEFILLCGPSGSGKTTFLRHLKHLIAPTGNVSGNIYYKGEDIQKTNERTLVSEIGYVFQNPESQIVCDRAFAEMAFGLENLGFSSNEIRRRVAEMASFFGIEHYFESDTHTLSGGQKQLLNLASIMVMQPSVILLDEPTSMLDPVSTNEFLTIVDKINKGLGHTVIICEHQLENVYSMVDKVCFMEEGKISAFDTPENVAKKLIAENNPMTYALPTSARIFSNLSEDKSFKPSEIPLNVREGRRFLKDIVSKIESPDFSKIKNTDGNARYNENDTALLLRNAYFRYQKDLPDVLKNIDLAVCYGEIHSILGGNGVGKTTLLSILCGINRPYRGKLKNNTDKGNILYLPQNPQLVFVKDTVLEDLHFILDHNKLDQGLLDQTIKKYDFFHGIETLFNLNPLDLSGGEQQQTALLKLLILSPKVLILDEPTKGLDAFAKNNLSKILLELKEEGVAILLVTHDLEFAAEFSDRCIMMFNGEIVSSDRPVSFFSNNHFYTTGSSKISKNILEHTITVKGVTENVKLLAD